MARMAFLQSLPAASTRYPLNQTMTLSILDVVSSSSRELGLLTCRPKPKWRVASPRNGLGGLSLMVRVTFPLNKATTLSIPDVVDTMSNLWTLSNKRRTSSKNVAGELGLLSCWAESMWRRKMVSSSRRRRHRRFVRHGSLRTGVLSTSSRVSTKHPF
jgi:hypothetical protein